MLAFSGFNLNDQENKIPSTVIENKGLENFLYMQIEFKLRVDCIDGGLSM